MGRFILFVVLLLASACRHTPTSPTPTTSPATPAPTTTPPPAVPVVTLSGIVTDAVLGVPIAGATVSLPQTWTTGHTLSATTDGLTPAQASESAHVV